LKKLVDEWEKLWKELEKLSGNENADEDVGDVDGNLTARSIRDVASICVPIDLTQRTSPMCGVVDWIRSSFAPSHAAQIQKTEEERMRIQHILNRLRRIHNRIFGRQQRPRPRCSPSQSAIGKQLVRLTFRVLRVQSINADLNLHAKSLQTSNERLSSTLDDMKRTASDATVEAGRAVLRYETLKKKYKSMDISHRQLVDRSNIDRMRLPSSGRSMQGCPSSPIYDMIEMEEICVKYHKMSQEVHELSSKNARLSEEINQKEREWEVRYQKETKRCEGLVGQVKCLSEQGSVTPHYYSDNCSERLHVFGPAECGTNDDGGHRMGSKKRVNN
jgi:outer membrane murein-binding lipoprotein Lpp